MNPVLITQIALLFVIFGLCFLAVFLPLKLVPGESKKDVTAKSKRIFSLCNCFSGGVFLGTCFLQLVPFVEDKFNSIFYISGVNLQLTSPVSQVTIMAGFFLILLIEQLVRVCQRKQNQAENIELLQMTLTSDEDESEIEIDSERQQMLQKPDSEQNIPPGRNMTESVPPSTLLDGQTKRIKQGNGAAHRHTHHGNDGHGHSHLTDIVKQDFGLRCLLLLFALSIHSLFEGIAVGLQDDMYKLVTLFVGVAVHEILVAFAIGISLAQQNLKFSTMLKLCLVFSSTIPVGMAIGLLMKGITSLLGQILSASVQGLTAGTFVYVTFLEILPAEINKPENRLLKVLFIFIGFAVIACLKFGIKEDGDTSQPYYQPLTY